jgi:hypothetical protein
MLPLLVETLVTCPLEPSELSRKLPVRTTDGQPQELAALKVTDRLDWPLHDEVGAAVAKEAETDEKPSSMLPSQSVSCPSQVSVAPGLTVRSESSQSEAFVEVEAGWVQARVPDVLP